MDNESLESNSLTIIDLKNAKQRDPSSVRHMPSSKSQINRVTGLYSISYNVFTSKRSQQDLLVEGHGPLVLTRYLVSHSLINGKAGH